MMSERPERKSDFRSGPLRSEVELQSKLNVARVDSSVAETAQNEVCAIENVEEVRLEHQVHTFSWQFEVLAQREVRCEEVGALDAADTTCTGAYRRGVGESSGIEPLRGIRVWHCDGLAGN